jgi:protein-disulfide isomerase-like protein with CxxC motif
MAKIDYFMRVRSSRVACLSSITCSWCYGLACRGNSPRPARNSFFGVPVTGTTRGNRPQDHEFQKNIWKAAQKHMRAVHGRKIVANGIGGWKVVKISA